MSVTKYVISTKELGDTYFDDNLESKNDAIEQFLKDYPDQKREDITYAGVTSYYKGYLIYLDALRSAMRDDYTVSANDAACIADEVYDWNCHVNCPSAWYDAIDTLTSQGINITK